MTACHTTENWRSYSDFYQHSYAEFAQEHRIAPGRLPFRMIKVDQCDHDLSDPCVPEIVLALPLRADQNNAWDWDMGDGWRHDSAAPGKMLLMPPDCPSHWHVKGARQLLVLTVATSTVSNILGLHTSGKLHEMLRPLTERTWSDELVSQLMLHLWQSAAGRCATDRVLADGALVTLVAQLAGRAGAQLAPSRLVALPAWRLQRVCDYVDAHVHEPISVYGMAAAAGLSVRHFARVFRQEMGETPHRWLTARRLARAAELLRQGHMPLAQIAQSCGFAGQSHFCKCFRQLTGQTPRRWVHQQGDESA